VARLKAEVIVPTNASSGDGGLSGLGRRLMGALPPMHELAKQAGLELPEFLGKIAGESREGESAPQSGKAKSELRVEKAAPEE
jgi:hypothetical protein